MTNLPEIASKIRRMAAMMLGVKPAEIEGKPLRAAGADSIDVVELIMTAENEFGVSIADNGFGLTLANEVQIWARDQATAWSTPRASDGEKGGPNMAGSKGDQPLPAMAANWPTATATARMYRGGGQAVTRADGKSRLDMLDWAAENWPTPMAGSAGTESYNAAGNSDFSRRATGLADGIVGRFSSPVRPTLAGRTCSSSALSLYLRIRRTTDSPLRSEMRALLRMAVRSRKPGSKWRKGWARPKTFAPFVRPSFRRRLNPVFVEALMRWPGGWTNCGCSATALTLWLSHMRSFVCSLGTATPPAQGKLL